MEIVQNSGYLDKLPSGSYVLADRGFKQVETVLSQKKCTLLRPPSVSQKTKMSKEEARHTKEERLIRVVWSDVIADSIISSDEGRKLPCVWSFHRHRVSSMEQEYFMEFEAQCVDCESKLTQRKHQAKALKVTVTQSVILKFSVQSMWIVPPNPALIDVLNVMYSSISCQVARSHCAIPIAMMKATAR
ncbi:hypothetical protein M8J77_021559 [Diaphorina citri]|nr:hypothetical protein M8J77_021559 [Diaphorina citri]